MTELEFGLVTSAQEIDQAEANEALGFDSLWVSEHILFYGPTLEAVPVLGALAARTKRARLGTAIFLLPLRHPTIVAKSFGTLDIISNGRVILGMGVGGEYPKEFEACGVPVNERGPRSNESMRLIRRLWTEDHVTFQGRFYSVDDVTMQPKPVQAGGPPIWVAGRSEAAMRRAGRLGDGYFPYLYSPERYRDGRQKVSEYAEQAGRDPAQITWALYQFTCIADTLDEARQRSAAMLQRTYQQPFEHLVDRYSVMGTPDDCVRRLGDYIEAGVRHIVFVPQSPPEQRREHIEVIAKEIIPRLRTAAGQ